MEALKTPDAMASECQGTESPGVHCEMPTVTAHADGLDIRARPTSLKMHDTTTAQIQKLKKQ